MTQPSTYAFKYLTRTHYGPAAVYVLDHRIRPETRAMLCAMVSRMPTGGIAQRYLEVIDALAQEDLETDNPMVYINEEMTESRPMTWDELQTGRWPAALKQLRARAEERLTHTVPPRVQRFMDDFVGKYGHSSILELTGEPTVFVEGVSWYTAWLSFDGPLVKGQELSTRAKAYRDWPLCAEAYDEVDDDDVRP